MVCCFLLCGASVLAGVAVLLVLYWHKLRNGHYWKKKNIPSDVPLPFVGNYLELFLKGSTFFHLEQRRYNKFGRIFGSYEGFMPVLCVGEPELLRAMMVKDFHCFADRREHVNNDPIFGMTIAHLTGDRWKRVRSVVTPAFSTGKTKNMVNLMQDCVETNSRNLLSASESGESIDAQKLFSAFGLDVISSVVFGTKLDSAGNPDNIFVQEVMKLFHTDFAWRFIFINMLPGVAKVIGLKPVNPVSSQFFVDFSRDVIRKRIQQNTRRNDLLQLLLDAKQNSEDGSISIDNDHKTEEPKEEFSLSIFEQYCKTKSITEDEFIAQCVLFLTAGFEGVSTTLSMVAYFMALNPECQDKLVNEIDELVLKYPDLGYDAVQEAVYLDMVLSETLRMAPPGVRLSREANQDYKLGDTGIVIPKGMNVIFPVYAMHHDPEFFPEPEKFIPERFSSENKVKIRPYSYLPFGAGPRHCIGMRLAQLEMKICILGIFRRFTFEPGADTDIPLKFYKGAFQFKPRRISLKVVKRNLK